MNSGGSIGIDPTILPRQLPITPSREEYVLQSLIEQVSDGIDPSTQLQIRTSGAIPSPVNQSTSLGFAVGKRGTAIGWYGSILTAQQLQESLPEKYNKNKWHAGLPGLTKALEKTLPNPKYDEELGPTLLRDPDEPSWLIKLSQNNSESDTLRSQYVDESLPTAQIILRDYNWIIPERVKSITEHITNFTRKQRRTSVRIISDREAINGGCGKLYRALKQAGIPVTVQTNYTRVPGFHDSIIQIPNAISISNYHELESLKN
jgi:hypothetical protein